MTAKDGNDACPGGSYCHRLSGVSRCCKEDEPIKSCHDTTYGCCPDGKTPAPGINSAGCPSTCACNSLGSFSKTCDPMTHQCTCKPGVTGVRCDRCEPGFWGLKLIDEANVGCQQCGCNIFGSMRDDCDQSTGRCVCKPGIEGQKCQECSNGKMLGPAGCTDAVPPVRSCRDLTCLYGALCEMTNGFAECVCTAECIDEYPMKVCGTDQQTYGSSCQLQHLACRMQQDIRVAYLGECTGSTSSRKTTRHVTTNYFVEATSSAPYGMLGEFCMEDDDCLGLNSYCKTGMCVCVAGYEVDLHSNRCQVSSFMVPRFSGNSYLQLTKMDNTDQMLDIEVEFRSSTMHGILLYNAQNSDARGDFISLAINDGYVEFKYDLGSGAAKIRSQQRISLNTFHHVKAKRRGKEGMLQLDSNPVIGGTSTGSLTSLNLKTPLYVGNVPDASEVVLTNIGVSVGLSGCVQSLKVITDKEKVYNLMYPMSEDIEDHNSIVECGQNPCGSTPCQNGATCVVLNEENYECHCPIGYTGSICVDADEEAVSSCIPNPCQQGGTCVGLTAGGYFCTCPPNTSGDNCQEEGVTDIAVPESDITVPEFRGHSYIETKLSKRPGQSLNWELWFLASKPDGVLLYGVQEDKPLNQADFLSLSLTDGYLQFRYDLGSGMADIVSPSKISLNVWHKVSISRLKKDGTMIIDDNDVTISGSSQGNLNELNLPRKVYIGGYTGDYHPNSGVSSGLRGAVQRFFENGVQVEDLVGSALSAQHIHQYDGEPCASNINQCGNGGVCIPNLNDYKCLCKGGFIGSTCDTDASTVDIDGPIAFDGATSTYQQYPNTANGKQYGQKKNRYEVRFNTVVDAGLILLQHKTGDVQGDYLAIALVNGYVEVSYNLGKQPADDLHMLRSEVTVNDGTWHTLVFTRDKRKGTLEIDGGVPVSSVSLEGATQLDTDGNLWLGGADAVPAGLPDHYYIGYTGCIDKVYIGDQELVLVKNPLASPLTVCDL